jgi:hypothetical protein
MSAMRRAVGFTEHHMHVNLRLAVRLRDVADEREHFDLLDNGNPFVVAFLEIKKAEHTIAERADGRELARTELILFRKSFQSLDNLVGAAISKLTAFCG